MSCIVAIKDKGRVWMGGDSRAANSISHLNAPSSSKVFHCGPMLIGSTGSPRALQLLRYVFEPKDYDSRTDPMAYLVKDFVPSFRELLKEHGATVEDNSNESNGDRMYSWFVIGLAGRIFKLESCFQVIEFDADYATEGSGDEVALGALYAMDSKLSPEKRITIALEAASYYDPSNVGPPFVIESIGE